VDALKKIFELLLRLRRAHERQRADDLLVVEIAPLLDTPAQSN